MNRREFLRQTTGAGLAGSAAGLARGVSLVVDPDDPVASAAPARWAAGELRRALEEHGTAVRSRAALDQADPAESCVLAAGASSALAREILRAAGVEAPSGAEALALAPDRAAGRPVLLACGSDVRGLVYALLELADRVRLGAGLEMSHALVERPANQVRSVTRCFVSDVEDKPWYWDRSMWGPYLSMLAAERFNRFSLAFCIGYDFPRNIRDCYLHFAYPFLLAVPGYDVRARGLADAERYRNFSLLRHIAAETAARGLQFQLALWTHGYVWEDSPHANYVIEGLTPETHAAYCRDALYEVLEACPAVSGVTLRVHGESGVAEGSYGFWKTLFQGITRTGRPIEIDMHAKGMDRRMIDLALATGLPVKISPKLCAEHMGLPYHQAAIRELEMPPKEQASNRFFALSSGSRRFLRYCYGDLFDENRRYGVLFRVWPGTQRLLRWGDPAFAAGYGRAANFCGADGLELCEPLSFKGRKGSGLPGGRNAYAEASLAPRFDWQKYLYTYRLWGRNLYRPGAQPEAWRRLLAAQFAAGAPEAEAALSSASRILPLVTTAHGPSAANNSYWPETYTNMPIVDPARKSPYSDTPSPKRFGTVSPFDPELFSRVDDCAAELLAGEPSGKYSPLEVAQWLEDLAAAASKHLERIAAAGVEAQRLRADVAIQAGLGRFFAWKLRSGVLYAIYGRTSNAEALRQALEAYRRARAAWVELAEHARVYRADITFGFDAHLRGHWRDRLPAIDADLADMEKQPAGGSDKGASAVRAALARPRRPPLACRHTPVQHFRPGQPLAIELAAAGPVSVRLHYRHVNQAESYRVVEMQNHDGRHRVVIPGEYTDSPFPLQYYFVLRQPDAAWIYPGFDKTLANQPYFVVRRA